MTWNVEANNPCLGSWVGVHAVIEVASTLIRLNWTQAVATASYRLFALELRFWWDFKAMVFITNVTKQQESGRVLPSIHRPKPSSLFFASDTMGTKVCWSMFSVCRIRPSDTIEFLPRRLFMSSEGGNTSSPLHVIRGWKYIGFCPAFQSGSELSFPAINDH